MPVIQGWPQENDSADAIDGLRQQGGLTESLSQPNSLSQSNLLTQPHPFAIESLSTESSSNDLFDQSNHLREQFGWDGSGQTAVIIDTGIASDHVTLLPTDGSNVDGFGFGPGYRVVGGWDFAENDALPYDDGPSGYHGTHVASVLGGYVEGSSQYAGIAPGADLIALRVFDDQGQSNMECCLLYTSPSPRDA